MKNLRFDHNLQHYSHTKNQCESSDALTQKCATTRTNWLITDSLIVSQFCPCGDALLSDDSHCFLFAGTKRTSDLFNYCACGSIGKYICCDCCQKLLTGNRGRRVSNNIILYHSLTYSWDTTINKVQCCFLCSQNAIMHCLSIAQEEGKPPVSLLRRSSKLLVKVV